jgi:protein tyrosine phosphatase (PTP) superfamily phosphohydrolase (DUF442 family)
MKRAAPLFVLLAGIAHAAPNTVEVSPRLVTSGQPDVQELRTLKARGFDAVIYLAPPTVHDAVADEQKIVAGQGLVFINLPIRFDNPTDADFDAFAALLKSLGERKVLVHCQINLRASSMAFLYRAIVLKDDPRLAYDAVHKVWMPDEVWKRFIERQLARHKIDFQPL